MKKTIIPRNDPERVLWLNAFAKSLKKYAPKYNIADADAEAVTAMAAFYSYWVSALVSIRDFASKVTSFKNNMASGVEPNADNPTQPALPELSAPPAMVTAGIFPFIMTLIKRIKAHKDYVSDDGEEMGIEGDDITPEDVNSLKPVIKIALVNGGFPELKWVKKGTDGIYISVNRGSGWEFLAIDTIPDYIDKHPLPVLGQSAVWQYRAIYRMEDENVGQWCDPISITVTGV